jgi:ADP-ribosylglycohydrolase
MQRALRSPEGLSVGDAFGEQLLAQPATTLGRLERREVLGGMWPYTDDTVMAMSIVSRSITTAASITSGSQSASHESTSWIRRGATDARLSSCCRRFARGRDWRQAALAAFGGKGSMGNGGAMRAAPIGAYFAGDLGTAAAEARLSAEVTHAHLEGQAGAMAVAAAAAWVAARPSEPAGLFAAVLDVVPMGETRYGIEKAAGLAGDTDVFAVVSLVGHGLRVLAQDTVPFALWCVCHHGDDYSRALWTAVSCFGDCDTLGAIVGGIVALHPGARGIPEEWRQHREPLSAMLRLEPRADPD